LNLGFLALLADLLAFMEPPKGPFQYSRSKVDICYLSVEKETDKSSPAATHTYLEIAQ
jgi:hypothetical protein